MVSTKLKVHGIIYRFIMAVMMFVLMIAMAIVHPLKLIFGYIADGQCPYCNTSLTLTKRVNAVKCERCGFSSFVREGRLVGVDCG